MPFGASLFFHSCLQSKRFYKNDINRADPWFSFVETVCRLLSSKGCLNLKNEPNI